MWTWREKITRGGKRSGHLFLTLIPDYYPAERESRKGTYERQAWRTRRGSLSTLKIPRELLIFLRLYVPTCECVTRALALSFPFLFCSSLQAAVIERRVKYHRRIKGGPHSFFGVDSMCADGVPPGEEPLTMETPPTPRTPWPKKKTPAFLLICCCHLSYLIL